MTVLQTQSRFPGSPLGWLPFVERLLCRRREARRARAAMARRAVLPNRAPGANALCDGEQTPRQRADEELRAAWRLFAWRDPMGRL